MLNHMSDELIIEHNGKFKLKSGLPEFGYELIAILPYAYYLYQNNLLESTCSGYDTKVLYFFSPEHCEVSGKRSWDNVRLLQNSGFPNAKIHQAKLDLSQFSPPPLKEHYASSAIRFAKPTIVICNRYNQEWNGTPVNFISPACLAQLFDLLCDKYQIVYIDTQYFTGNYSDHADFLDSPCQQVVLEYSGRILTFLDLQANYPELSLNELQCRLYAGCERFISSNGGLGIFCSYFGGENIIFSKTCHELDPEINSFYAWYSYLSHAMISVVRNELQLLELCQQKWLLEVPLINLLITTRDCPNYFHDCLKSIYAQDYKNYHIIVGTENIANLEYIQGHCCTVVTRFANEIDLFSKMKEFVSTGYYLCLEETQQLSSVSSLSLLAQQLKRQANIISNDLSPLVCSQVTSAVNTSIDKLHIDRESFPPLVVVISSLNSILYLESCLDSIVRQIKPLNCPAFKVIVSIRDVNLSIAKKLTRKYLDLVEFYYASTLVDEMDLFFSALKKIVRKDSLILSISARAILPSNFISYYYTRWSNNVLGFFLKANSTKIVALKEIRTSANLVNYRFNQNYPGAHNELSLIKILDPDATDFDDTCISLLLGNISKKLKFRLNEVILGNQRLQMLKNYNLATESAITQSWHSGFIGLYTDFVAIQIGEQILLDDEPNDEDCPLLLMRTQSVSLINPMRFKQNSAYLHLNKIIHLDKLQ